MTPNERAEQVFADYGYAPVKPEWLKQLITEAIAEAARECPGCGEYEQRKIAAAIRKPPAEDEVHAALKSAIDKTVDKAAHPAIEQSRKDMRVTPEEHNRPIREDG
jgi:hypothetical protein